MSLYIARAGRKIEKVPYDKLFAEEVKRFRMKYDISQERLSVALGISLSAVKKMECEEIMNFSRFLKQTSKSRIDNFDDEDEDIKPRKKVF